MSSSYARRARRLARKGSPTPDYILEPETSDEWRTEIAEYLAYYEQELESDQPILRDRIAKLIEECPYGEVKAWARERYSRNRNLSLAVGARLPEA